MTFCDHKKMFGSSMMLFLFPTSFLYFLSFQTDVLLFWKIANLKIIQEGIRWDHSIRSRFFFFLKVDRNIIELGETKPNPSLVLW